MPYSIRDASWLSPNVKKFVVHAPHVTRNCQPGQFVIVRAEVDGERIPLTIAHANKEAGEIQLIVQSLGLTTAALCQFNTGDAIPDVAGPMGRQTHITHVGHAVLVGGGVGTAVIYPQALALKQQQNRVSAIIGGRSKPFIILENELTRICNAVYPCTDDGSYGFHGFVTQRLTQLIADAATAGDPVKEVIAAGPVPMMRAVAEVTRPLAIHTVVSLNPIMVDGTGMCGGCRVREGGQTKFACVDGPEFDAHQVDFKELADRLTAYRSFEQHQCHSGQAGGQ